MKKAVKVLLIAGFLVLAIPTAASASTGTSSITGGNAPKGIYAGSDFRDGTQARQADVVETAVTQGGVQLIEVTNPTAAWRVLHPQADCQTSESQTTCFDKAIDEWTDGEKVIAFVGGLLLGVSFGCGLVLVFRKTW